jgi:hypothetical protein
VNRGDELLIFKARENSEDLFFGREWRSRCRKRPHFRLNSLKPNDGRRNVWEATLRIKRVRRLESIIRLRLHEMPPAIQEGLFPQAIHPEFQIPS